MCSFNVRPSFCISFSFFSLMVIWLSFSGEFYIYYKIQCLNLSTKRIVWAGALVLLSLYYFQIISDVSNAYLFSPVSCSPFLFFLFCFFTLFYWKLPMFNLTVQAGSQFVLSYDLHLIYYSNEVFLLEIDYCVAYWCLCCLYSVLTIVLFHTLYLTIISYVWEFFS